MTMKKKYARAHEYAFTPRIVNCESVRQYRVAPIAMTSSDKMERGDGTSRSMKRHSTTVTAIGEQALTTMIVSTLDDDSACILV